MFGGGKGGCELEKDAKQRAKKVRRYRRTLREREHLFLIVFVVSLISFPSLSLFVADEDSTTFRRCQDARKYHFRRFQCQFFGFLLLMVLKMQEVYTLHCSCGRVIFR